MYVLLITVIIIHFLIACFPRDCKEAYNQGNTCSGVYTIKPDELPAFKVTRHNTVNINVFISVGSTGLL